MEVEKDRTILSAANSCGIYINSVCGGDGVCGKCKVIVRSGEVVTLPNGIISLEDKKKGIYLACLTTVHGDLEVEIPVESRQYFEKVPERKIDERLKGFYVKPEELQAQPPIGTEKSFDHSPFIEKLYLELDRPNLEDNTGDLERLYQGIRSSSNFNLVRRIDFNVLRTGLANIKQLGELLRDSDWQITVTLALGEGVTEILAIESGDTTQNNFGVCFDIGTTTITGQLVNLNTAGVLGTKAVYNKQASFGSDVITRIIFAQEEGGLEKLHQAVSDTINQIIKELISEHAVDLNDVNCIFCTGNTTMIHLLLSIDPTYIRRQPYVPTANFFPAIRAGEAGIHISPRGLLVCVPGVSSYVGGDTTCGVLSSGLHAQEELGLLIDIGTNGEIALGNNEFLISAAASAGPAFEGSGVACGMRAGNGAIEKVKINAADLNLSYSTIGNTAPRGICGSGYISLIAELLRAGVIDRSGMILIDHKTRIRNTEEGRQFVVVFKEETQTGADIVITESDIENLKRAKAAIYSASAILVRHMEMDFGQIKRIYIAGGFGNVLDIESAVSIGLLPDLERTLFSFIGNSAIAGAREMLFSAQARERADEIARKMAYLELSVEPRYMDEYMAALFFPHTDLSKFPNSRF